MIKLHNFASCLNLLLKGNFSYFQVHIIMQELRYSRIKVVVTKLGLVTDSCHPLPSPHLCQEILLVLESCLHSLTVTMFPALSTLPSVKCPCLVSKVGGYIL